jgi:hypothetical protein
MLLFSELEEIAESKAYRLKIETFGETEFSAVQLCDKKPAPTPGP